MRSRISFCYLLAFIAGPLLAGDIVSDRGLREADKRVNEMAGWAPRGPIVVRVDSLQRLDSLQEVVGDARLIGVETEAEALEAMPQATAIMGFCSRALIEAAPALHWIQLYSSGAERCIEQAEGADNALLITNMQRVNSEPIADHAMAMLLALSRGLVPYIRTQADGEWNPGRVPRAERRELGGQTMLLVGLGGIGTEIGQRAAGFGMRITAVRASGRPGPEYVAEVAKPDQLLRLAAEADVVVNSVPLTPETHAIFDAEFFAAMKPTAWFINVGRGRSVVTADLVAALEAGELAGAGLDVTDPEPLPDDHPLWGMPSVIITPHIAGGSDRVFERLFLLVRENLRRYVSGEPMLSVVDVERGY